LAKHRFFATDKELATIMSRFDKKGEGIITYGDFMDEISP